MKNQKGITLIALVITIIVLLILAGISISMVVGDNGVLHQATKSKEETRAASVEEARDIWKSENKIDEVTEEKESRSLDEVLTELETNGLITSEERIIIEETGKVTIASREIEFIEMEDLLVELGWDFENKQMIAIVNFRKNNYDAYARDILEGKDDEEIVEIFLESENYWNKQLENGAPEFADFDEFSAYWATQGDTFTTPEEMAEYMGYINFSELTIFSKRVKYEEYLNQDISGTVTFPDGTTARVSRDTNAEYVINADATYKFSGITDDGKMGTANITTEFDSKYHLVGNGDSLNRTNSSIFIAYGYNQECEITTDNEPVIKIESTNEEIELSDYIHYVSYYEQYYVYMYDAFDRKIGDMGTVTFTIDGQTITWYGRFYPEVF